MSHPPPFPPEVQLYTSRNILVVPIKPNSKVPAYKKLNDYVNCVLERGIEQCFSCSNCNVGILLNPPTPYRKLILVDIDFKDEEILKKIAEILPCEVLWIEETKRGYHIYIIREDDLPATNKSIRTPKGNIDIKVNGYSVAFPSVVDGFKYKLYKGKLPKPVQVNDFCSMTYQEFINILNALLTPPTKLPERLKQLIEILKDDYKEGNRNNIVHALVGVLWRNGYDEDVIREFVVELGRTYNDEEVDEAKKDRKSVVTSTIRVCKATPNKCPSFKALKEVVSEETYKKILRLFGKKKTKQTKMLIRKSSSVEEYIALSKRGFKIVKVKPVLGKEAKKQIAETIYISRKVNLAVRKFNDNNVGRGFVFKINNDLWFVHESSLEPFLKEKLGLDRKYIGYAVGLLDRIQGTYKGPIVSGIWFDYNITNRIKMYVSSNDNYSDWLLPYVGGCLDAIEEFKKMYEAYGEVFVEAIAWTLMALLRLPLKERGVHVPILVLAGRVDRGKTFLSEFLKKTFDLRVLGGGVTRANIERFMSTSAVPFIIDTPDMNNILEEAEDVLVSAVSGYLKLRTVHHVQYKGTRFAFSIPLLVVNRPRIRETYFDKIAFILFDNELKIKKELLEYVDLNKKLMGVGKFLLEKGIEVAKKEIKGTNRVERVLDVFSKLKQITCKTVGVDCGDNRMYFSYLNSIDDITWTAERCTNCNETDEGIVCECTLLGCWRMGGRKIGKKKGLIKCLMPEFIY